MTVVLITAAVTESVYKRSSEGAAPALERPNIVLILTDDQSFESVSRMPYVSGYDDWISFENAFFNVALCCPSRVSILSGQYSHRTGVERNTDGALFRDSHSIATWLRSAGYSTALIGKYLNQYPWGRGNYIPPGWDHWQVFKDIGYFDYTLNDNGKEIRKGRKATAYSTDVLTREATTFIARQTRPFFLMLAPNAPHGPRTPAPRHRSAFADDAMPIPTSFNESDVADKPAWVRALPEVSANVYTKQRRKQYRALLAVDDMVRAVFGALKEKGDDDKTVVIFMTDNGYSFGEHRHVRKTCPYEECIRTPLLVRYPGVRGKKEAALAQNVDIAPTVADLAGVTPSIHQDGRSLVPLIRGTPTPWRSRILLHWAGHRAGTDIKGDSDIPPFWGIRTSRYKYIELETGEKELYDLHLDPHELDSQAGNPASARLLADLARQLATLRQS